MVLGSVLYSLVGVGGLRGRPLYPLDAGGDT